MEIIVTSLFACSVFLSGLVLWTLKAVVAEQKEIHAETRLNRINISNCAQAIEPLNTRFLELRQVARDDKTEAILTDVLDRIERYGMFTQDFRTELAAALESIEKRRILDRAQDWKSISSMAKLRADEVIDGNA